MTCRKNEATGACKSAHHPILLFRNKSSHMIGIITITQMTPKNTARNTRRMMNFVRRPYIKSVVAFMAVIGYIPGTETAIRAVNDTGNK